MVSDPPIRGVIPLQALKAVQDGVSSAVEQRGLPPVEFLWTFFGVNSVGHVQNRSPSLLLSIWITVKVRHLPDVERLITS